jgi:cytochrome oxidase assembly protein ShyY1
MKTVIFLIMWIAVIVAGIELGNWQLHRLEWKTRLLNNINLARATPDSTPLVPAQIYPVYADDTTFYHGRLNGYMFDLNSMLVGPRTHDGQIGYHWYTLVKHPSGIKIWLNRGFVPNGFLPDRIGNLEITLPVTLRLPTFSGEVLHLVRVPTDKGKTRLALVKAGPFTPDALKLGDPDTSILVAYPLKKVRGDDLGVLLDAWPTPVNNHLAYAIFWFVMSGVAGLFGLVAIWSRLTHHKGRC